MTMPVPRLIVGNWKMNGTRRALSEVETLARALRNQAAICQVAVCPPATLLQQVTVATGHGAVKTGGQDCHAAEIGAHTGDISASMLRDAGATYVIVGHSERRTAHGETDGTVRIKARAALDAGLIPIICVGETAIERETGVAVTVVEQQMQGSTPELTADEVVVVAYEPVWAIGTGLVPTEQDIAEMHSAIRAWLARHLGDAGPRISILYGGSMKPDNAASILAIDNVDGGLIGGASLKAEDFLAIIRCA